MKNASSLKTHPTTRFVLLCLLVAVFFAWLSPPAMSMDRDAWEKSKIGAKIPERMDDWPWVEPSHSPNNRSLEDTGDNWVFTVVRYVAVPLGLVIPVPYNQEMQSRQPKPELSNREWQR